MHFTQIWMAVVEAGGTPVLVAPSPGTAQTLGERTEGNSFDVDVTLTEADADTFDGLVLIGGLASSDTLRTSERARELVRDLVRAGRPVGSVGHAAWLLADAGVTGGRQVTSWPSLAPDLIGAGARWRDQAVVVDGPVVTARHSGDLPEFCNAFVSAIAARRLTPAGQRDSRSS